MMLNRIVQCLRKYIENGQQLHATMPFVLRHVLEAIEEKYGFIACFVSSQDLQLTVVALEGTIQLNGKRLKIFDTMETKQSLRNSKLQLFEFFFKHKLAGIVGIETEQFNLEETLYPLLTTCANITSGYRLMREAKDSHDMFIATMSHEIRTPLTSIIGNARLLLDDPATPMEAKENVQIIHNCGFQLLEIINDMLDFSNLESERISLRPVSFSIRKCIQTAMDVIYIKARAKRLNLEFHIGPNCPEYLFADATRLRQVMINLLNNSVKFTEYGSISLEATYDKETALLTIRVKDTGIGIDASDIPKIFRTFSQIKTSRITNNPGLGLGLSICRKIITLMKGKIMVEQSKVNQGTCMMFQVPVQCGEPPVEELYAWTEGKFALIIAKNLQKRILLCDMLVKVRMKPFACYSVEEAQTYLQAFQLDVIFVDQTYLSEETETQLTLSEVPIVVLAKNDAETKEYRYMLENITTRTVYNLLKECLDFQDESKSKSNSLKVKKGLKILIAEDNHVNRETIYKSLIQMGYATQCVRTVTNGQEAVDVFRGWFPDVILMDIQMPVKNGYEATREILQEAKESKEKVVIIAMTAYVTQPEKDKCMEAGMEAFLPKPVIREDLDILLQVCAARKNK